MIDLLADKTVQDEALFEQKQGQPK